MMRLCEVPRWLTLLLIMTLMSVIPARAELTPITKITLEKTSPAEGADVLLPHFLSQPHSGLVTFDWSFKLPPATGSIRLPTLLIPQPVQGATFWIGDEEIYEIASSDTDNLRHWYRPIIISVPRHLLSASEWTVIRVRQTGHLRGWFVSPMFFGELADLRPWLDGFTLLSQTLSVTINFFTAGIGLFLLGIGWRSQSSTYMYGGLSISVWSLLFSLGLSSEIPTRDWFYWRLTLYMLTGLQIYFLSVFMVQIFKRKLDTRLNWAYFIYLNSGWFIFAMGGAKTEFILDFYWTGSAISIYAGTAVWLMINALKQRKLAILIPFLLHSLFSSFFAFHDYILQSGWLPLKLSSQTAPLWAYAVLQPIYLTHLTLTSFVIVALWMLAQDHLNKTREALQHEQLLQQQREQMVLDIHDGVGSRLNMLLWNLRTSVNTPDDLELELQKCMDELRFAINPIEAGHETLNKALGDLCQRLRHVLPKVRITYALQGQLRAVRSDQGIQLYKATQECINNAVQHSQASRIEIELIQLNNTVNVIIKDDGVGIPGWDETAQIQIPKKPTSLGLQGLQQRMRSKGGDVYIQSGPQGTCVKCWVSVLPSAP